MKSPDFNFNFIYRIIIKKGAENSAPLLFYFLVLYTSHLSFDFTQ